MATLGPDRQDNGAGADGWQASSRFGVLTGIAFGAVAVAFLVATVWEAITR